MCDSSCMCVCVCGGGYERERERERDTFVYGCIDIYIYLPPLPGEKDL